MIFSVGRERKYEHDYFNNEYLILHDLEKEGVKISKEKLRTILRKCHEYELLD